MKPIYWPSKNDDVFSYAMDKIPSPVKWSYVDERHEMLIPEFGPEQVNCVTICEQDINHLPSRFLFVIRMKFL